MKNIFKWTCGLIPALFGNLVVVYFYELLRNFQKLFGKKDWGSFEKNAENLRQHIEAAVKRNGFIEDQNNFTDVSLGKVTMKYAGCEIFAVYNSLVALGKGSDALRLFEGREEKAESGKLEDQDKITSQGKLLANLIRYFEGDGIVLSGAFGTAPKALFDYFKKLGCNARLVTRERDFEELAEGSVCMILTMYNDRKDITKEVHTVSITKQPEGYVAHNVYCNGKVIGPCKSVTELIGCFNGGKSKGISLIGIS